MARRRTTSRSVDHLLTDFGSRLPRKDAEPPEPPADKPFPRVIRVIVVLNKWLPPRRSHV